MCSRKLGGIPHLSDFLFNQGGSAPARHLLLVGELLWGSVIYAKGQFSPAGSGRVAQICAQGPKSSCVAAAQAALGGASYVGAATKFRPVSSGYEGIVVGNHVFW